MLQVGDFHGDVESFLYYARSLEPKAAVKAFRALLDSQDCRATFKDWCRTWFSLASQLAESRDWTPLEFVGEFTTVLMADRPDNDAAREMLPSVFANLGALYPESSPFVQKLVKWFVDKADAGEARTAAECLNMAWMPMPESVEERHLTKDFLPLVEWLLLNGTAELRIAARGELVARLVDCVHRYSSRAMVLNAVRFATLHNGAAQATKWYKPDGLWPAIETALDLGESPAIVADFLQALAPDYEKWGPDHFYRPLEPGRKDLLKSREAIVRTLIDGSLPQNRLAEGWKRVLRFHPRELPEIQLASEEQLQLITQTAMSVASSNEQFLDHDSPDPVRRALFTNPDAGKWPHMESWGEVLSKEWLRLHAQGELSMSATPMESPLYRLANNPWMWKGARRALAAFSAEQGKNNSLVNQMLAESDPESGFVTVAAARLLFPDQPPKRRVATDVELGEIEQLFSRVASFRWPEGRIGGVEPKKLFAGISKIQLVPKLEGEFKIKCSGGSLLVDQQYLADMVSRGGLTKRTRALALLYFLHEFVHELQGIGDIVAVRDLRSTGGETTLLHLDLAADHAAVFLAACVAPEFEALELREIQSSSVGGFPVGRYHGAASRARKAGRAVSCRVDYLARKHALVATGEIGDEYFFAEFGPNGGKLLVFLSGPPMRLIKAFPLAPEEANVLTSCLDVSANSKSRLSKLDAVLHHKLNANSDG